MRKFPIHSKQPKLSVATYLRIGTVIGMQSNLLNMITGAYTPNF